MGKTRNLVELLDNILINRDGISLCVLGGGGGGGGMGTN